MTEKEIIADMECCSKEDCENCSRFGKENCATGLYGDAIKVMKLMEKCLMAGSDAINELKAENGRLQIDWRRQIQNKIDTDDIIARVMRIAKEAVKHGECEGNWGKLSEEMRNFLFCMEASDKYIVILGEEMPEIVFKKRL